ncbi:CheR family methyltransferase [Trichlorobacter lovleyi]|uniref:CheR family methyltransferase n=1 Tax=Trichlorobacter lovleyi TaxID=313985 RepID=UPI0023F0B906|nr:CheR family methyltransferase [Trichlorobacter lovleyi]
MAFTFFFRDLPVLEYAVEHTLKLALGRLRIKVWDAGCALGQEPYTLAILFAERMGEMGFNTLYLDATDYDSENNFGDIVTAAEYKSEELQRIPPEIFGKYFEKVADKPGYHKVIDRIRNRVFFKYNDLLTLQPPGSDYSLIVCKNVLLHFSYEQRIEVLKMYHRSLAPGGYFATENTQKIPHEIRHLFEQVAPDAQLFRKVGE